jgi:hypothetical protein
MVKDSMLLVFRYIVHAQPIRFARPIYRIQMVNMRRLHQTPYDHGVESVSFRGIFFFIVYTHRLISLAMAVPQCYVKLLHRRLLLQKGPWLIQARHPHQASRMC